MTGALQAMIERAATVEPPAPAVTFERCGLCAAPIPDEHRHVLDLARREPLCACRACVLLFDRDGAGDRGRHWRLIPDRVVAVAQPKLDDLAWRALGLPVELAFFVRSGDSGRVAAFYPSPAGVTECSLELETWSQLETDDPRLGEMESDVEALLVDRRAPAEPRAFVVGIDHPYRLVAAIRTHWRGFGGGESVWREIDAFFARLDELARA